MSEKTCRRCGSDKIIPHVTLLDRSHHNFERQLRVGFATQPEALLLQGWVRGAVWADICGACGYLDLSIDNAAELYAAYQQRLARMKNQG